MGCARRAKNIIEIEKRGNRWTQERANQVSVNFLKEGRARKISHQRQICGDKLQKAKRMNELSPKYEPPGAYYVGKQLNVRFLTRANNDVISGGEGSRSRLGKIWGNSRARLYVKVAKRSSYPRETRVNKKRPNAERPQCHLILRR